MPSTSRPPWAPLALLVVLEVGNTGWSELGWFTEILAVAAIVLGFALPLLGVLRRSPTLPILETVVTSVVALAAVIGLLVDGVPVGALAAAIEMAGGLLRDEGRPRPRRGRSAPWTCARPRPRRDRRLP